MTDIDIDTIINRSLYALENSEYSEFDLLLNQLSYLIKQSVNSNNKTASKEQITRILDYTPNSFNQVESLRLYRGLLILVRNFAPSLNIDLFPIVANSFEKFLKALNQTSEWTDKIIEVYWQILANFQRNEFTEVTNEFFGQWECKYKWKDIPVSVMLPVIHFLFRQFNTQDPHITNENLLSLLKIFETNHVMNAVYEIFTIIDFAHTNNIGHDNKMFIHLLYDIITHESFQKWIEQQNEEEAITKWLSLTSVIVQTNTDWNNYELIALLSWNGSLFMKYAPLINSNRNTTVNGEDDLGYVEDDILAIIAIFAELSQFNATKQYFEHYEDLLPKLIFVFKWIHDNIEPITIKSSKIEEVGRYSSVKTNIITILSYLSYDSFQFQEKIRELGGLLLVLSNCIIDNNNPFIKEQAIVCLKYLLQKNPKNQQFVADLEAKKVVDDQVLLEVGYQVEVIDGKVAVKRK